MVLSPLPLPTTQCQVRCATSGAAPARGSVTRFKHGQCIGEKRARIARRRSGGFQRGAQANLLQVMKTNEAAAAAADPSLCKRARPRRCNLARQTWFSNGQLYCNENALLNGMYQRRPDGVSTIELVMFETSDEPSTQWQEWERLYAGPPFKVVYRWYNGSLPRGKSTCAKCLHLARAIQTEHSIENCCDVDKGVDITAQA
jgi:hypothetical protein